MVDEKQEPKDVLKPHSFDGIQEYDNQLPKWWINGFYLSIAFSMAYLFWFELGDGESLKQSFQKERAAEMAAASAKAARRKQYTEEELLAIAKNPEIMKLGAQQFEMKCASCHALDGGGLVGPNLTDHYSIHGNRMSDVVKVITQGVLAKGMPTWSSLMSESEIHAAAAYVKSLEGKKAAHPKPPEGELVK